MKRRREFTDDVHEPGLALALLGNMYSCLPLSGRL